MKHVHIVEPYHSAAMMRLAEPLELLSSLYKVTRSELPDQDADLNIHIPFHTLREKNKADIVMYTHCNPNSEREVVEICEKADIVTAMSFKGRDELYRMGVDPKKIWVIYSSASVPARRKRILIVGSVQPNGRKRESILLDLAYTCDLSQFEFWLVGASWEETHAKLQACGVASGVIPDAGDTKLAELYQNCDALLVTGYVEGGSLPILEAMSAGTRVIAPPVGYANDLLESCDLYETVEDLTDILRGMTRGADAYQGLVNTWTWGDYAAEYAMLIGRLLGESPELVRDSGMARYVQLLDIISEYRVKSVCEIGTWNAHRAVQMIQEASKYHSVDDLYYQGFDLFGGQTGEHFVREFSKRAIPYRVAHLRLSSTGAPFDLVAGNTRDTIRKILECELYFVDGGHSEETIKSDGDAVLRQVDRGAVAVFDDYYHEGGKVGLGCNTFIDSLDANKYEVTHLPVVTNGDGVKIGMVKVCRNISTGVMTERDRLLNSVFQNWTLPSSASVAVN